MKIVDMFSKPVVGSTLAKGQIVAAGWTEDEKMYRSMLDLEQPTLKSTIENSYQRAQPIKSKDFPCIYLDCPYRFTFQNIEQHLNDVHKVVKIKLG